MLKCIREDRVSPLPRYLLVRDASHAEIFHYGGIMTGARGAGEIAEAECRESRAALTDRDSVA